MLTLLLLYMAPDPAPPPNVPPATTAELDVLALTVVAGNAPLANTARNAARLVEVRRPARLPQLALGAATPLRRALVTAAPDDHGADGLDDVLDWPPVASPPASPSAAEALVALARAHAERLTLIALGPLTNLALALRLHRRVHGAAVPSLGLHAPARPFGGGSRCRREPGAMAAGADRRWRERPDPARGRRSELPRGPRH